VLAKAVENTATRASQSDLKNAENTAREAAVQFEQSVAEWRSNGACTPPPVRFALYLTDRFLCRVLDPLPKTPGVVAVRKVIVSQIDAISSMPDPPAPLTTNDSLSTPHLHQHHRKTIPGITRPLPTLDASTPGESKTMAQKRSLFPVRNGHTKGRKLLAAIGQLALQERDRRQHEPASQTSGMQGSRHVTFKHAIDSATSNTPVAIAQQGQQYNEDQSEDHSRRHRIDNLRKRFAELKATNGSTYKFPASTTMPPTHRTSQDANLSQAGQTGGRDGNDPKADRFAVLLERAQLQSSKIKEMKDSEDARKQLTAIRAEQRELSDMAPDSTLMMMQAQFRDNAALQQQQQQQQTQPN
jgi:hypothetical protein